MANKNIRPLGGIPLLQWSIMAAKELVAVDEILVSSDSEKILEMAEGWGAMAVLRPLELAADDSTDLDVIRHVYEKHPFILCVYLRPTTPFRTQTTLEKAIQTMIDAGDSADSLRSVEAMTETAWKCFEMPDPYLRPLAISMDVANQPNHLLPQTYRGNGYVDICKGSQVVAGDLWGSRCIGFVTKPTVEIDTEDDFILAEWRVATRRFYD